jgi:hypothetical protein
MPDPTEDLEAAWARIVADLTTELPTDDHFSTTRLAEADATARDPAAFVDSWSDEGHFTPMPPPEIPAGSPLTRLAWAGMLGGPATLLTIGFTGWSPPMPVPLGAGLATLAGFVTLVWLLPDSREDGWDDGAQV